MSDANSDITLLWFSRNKVLRRHLVYAFSQSEEQDSLESRLNLSDDEKITPSDSQLQSTHTYKNKNK